jgi:hypothetical protein
MAAPDQLHCSLGKIVPMMSKAWHTPGLNGNGDHTAVRGLGAETKMQAQGFTKIPQDFECIAFGERRIGYLDRWEQRRNDGLPGIVYWSDAWHRPRALGQRVVWDFDADGWADFLQRVLEYISPGKIDPAQIEIATTPLIQACRGLLGRDDGLGKRQLHEHLRQLPREYAPPDLLAAMPAET